MDRFDCYELCVQSPRHVVGFLRRVHGGEPTVLREDFCGTAAICRRWVDEGRRAGQRWRAVGVDLDAAVIERARRECASAGLAEDIELVCEDATEGGRSLQDRGIGVEGWLPRRTSANRRHTELGDGCDVIFVGNFSIGYIHERAALVRYLRASHERLSRGNAGFGGGVMVCDVYDGPGKYTLGSITRMHPGRGHETVRYTWEHREADALTSMVTNAIHFQVEVEGEVVDGGRMPDAFIYRWRLWSIPELREAMREAGFAFTEVYQDVGPDAAPLENGRELRESGIVCVIGRA
ncbi:MAG TPA: class I SAM-dependent methyltransferase [Phycisphaerales bacterium]|nr:class I SAM-dependent methyltransferase [Phycisphaerales bacterium]